MGIRPNCDANATGGLPHSNRRSFTKVGFGGENFAHETALYWRRLLNRLMGDTFYDRGAETPVDLSKYDEDYRRAKQTEFPAYKPVPDGKYQVIVENVELTKTRTTGNPMLKWRLRIAGPASADRVLWKNRVITERTMPFVAKELQLCGLRMESLNELPGKLAGLVNLRLEITKRGHENGRDDVYFDRNLTAAPASRAAAAETVYEEAERTEQYDDVNDDLPF